MYKLGIDIGGTKVNIGIVDKYGSIVAKRAEKLPDNKSIEIVLPWIKEQLDICLAQSGIRHSDIISCGIGVPGTVSKDGKKAVKVPNIGWENVNVAEMFENITSIPAALIQDSRAAAYGEYKAGNGKGKDMVVCITLGTGIGTGIVLNGNVFEGALGCAGEIGHVPVKENGRECGCGKKGCLECYAAGKGLDITAVELYGKGHTAADIFSKAAMGDETALDVISQAVIMLGNALVSVVNLISPDCLLFSGGMSRQKELFVEPLIQYIREHIYNGTPDKELYIGCAKLLDDAPMVGAALFPNITARKKSLFSASIMCADLLNLGSDLKTIESAGIDYIHFDIMDGHFVPNLMLPYEIINKIRKGTNLPFDIHLMLEKPENIIPSLNLQNDDIVSVHFESTPHVQRALTLIKSAGAKAALAINPSTPIEAVRETLDEVSVILVMTVNPGFSGQALVGHSFDKIRRMRRYLDGLGYTNISIEVDGNCSFENVPKMYEAGADIFVVGTSSVFNSETGIENGMKKLRASLSD